MDHPMICESSKSQAANTLCLKNRYTFFKACCNPCKKMRVHLNYQSKDPLGQQYVRFHMEPTIGSDEYVLAYTSLNLFAEIGSYLGLTLGVSIMSLHWIFQTLGKMIVSQLCRINA